MKGVTFYSLCYYHYYIVCLMLISSACGTIADDSYDQDGGIIGVPTPQPSNEIATTITVDSHGSGNYVRVQKAIDSIPLGNQNWIRILIKDGIYREKIVIPMGKGYIYMQGGGIQKTIIYANDHQTIDTSATFTALSDNIIISGITFKNTYNIRSAPGTQIVPAPAARLVGDKYLIIDSSFDGVQDTLYDCTGRHYYRRCVISGSIDFIFGYAQSIFEECTLTLDVKSLATGRVYGTITAQGRSSPMDNGGFVFKDCTITGNGKALLGRAWGPYARVIFYHSTFSDAILPIGWDAWNGKGQEGHLTFVEDGCTGVGADTSKRVPWLKKGSDQETLKLIDLSSINQDGWINRLPIKFIV